jgi:dUTP pyrophosphatase
MVKVLIKKLDKKVKLPEYKTTGSSGLDLTAFIEKKIVIKPGENALVPTGI